MTMTPGTRRRNLAIALALSGICPVTLVFAADSDSSGPPPPKSLSEVVIVGTTPLPGSGVDLDKVPSNVQTLGAADLDPDNHSDSIASAAARRMGSVNLNEIGRAHV